MTISHPYLSMGSGGIDSGGLESHTFTAVVISLTSGVHEELSFNQSLEIICEAAESQWTIEGPKTLHNLVGGSAFHLSTCGS